MRSPAFVGVRWLAAALLAAPLAANGASGFDMSDVWWKADEPGWGVQFVQQANVLFGSLFVYASDRSPAWYSATLAFLGETPGTRELNYAGDLYETSGPWVGIPTFDAGSVVYRKVGTMKLTAPVMERGTLTYTIDSVSVTKAITRYTFRFDDYNASYAGQWRLVTTKCDNPANNLTQVVPVTFTIVQSGSAMTMNASVNGGTCTYTGPYTQDGRLGRFSSTYRCSNGEIGALAFEEMSRQRFGLLGRLFGADNRGCHIEGAFAAIDQ